MATLPTPSGTLFGKFIGQWGQFVADTTDDENAEPDFVAASGTLDIIPEFIGEIKRFDLDISYTLSSLRGSLDENGYLRDANGALGVEVYASDSPGVPTGITYTIRKVINGVASTVNGIAILGGTEVDLQDIVQSAPSQPIFVSNDAILADILLEPGSKSNAAIQYLTGGGGAPPAAIDGGKPNSISTTGIDGGRP